MVYRKEFEVQTCDGPSKMDLFAALMTGAGHHPFRIRLEVKPGQKLPDTDESPKGYRYHASIIGVIYEDKGGNTFNVIGNLHDDLNGRLKDSINRRFEGFYNAQTRRGWIRFTADFADGRTTLPKKQPPETLRIVEDSEYEIEE